MLSTPLAVVRPQRLLTSRAHRLRKPHRTTQTSGILCRRAGLEPSAPRSPPLEPALPGLDLAIVGLAPRQTRTQDAFRRFDLRPCDRSRLARAPFNVRPRSPRTLFTHRESAPVVPRGPPRQADPRRRRPKPFGLVRPPGKMRLPSVCYRLTTRALHGSPGPRITASIGFHRDDSFHTRRPAETLAESMIEWSFA